jgi:hypothetical protein
MVVHAVASRVIRAAPERVSALYRDYLGWPQLFPATIRGTRLVGEEGSSKTIEVDHATEGKVVNVMTVLSPDEIRLEEHKRRYDARFVNRFEPHAQGTRYTVAAEVALKGPLRLLAAIARPIVRWQIDRFVLRPMQALVEAP